MSRCTQSRMSHCHYIHSHSCTPCNAYTATVHTKKQEKRATPTHTTPQTRANNYTTQLGHKYLNHRRPIGAMWQRFPSESKTPVPSRPDGAKWPSSVAILLRRVPCRLKSQDGGPLSVKQPVCHLWASRGSRSRGSYVVFLSRERLGRGSYAVFLSRESLARGSYVVFYSRESLARGSSVAFYSRESLARGS